MPLKPAFESTFEIPEEGTYLFKVESAELVDSDKGTNFRVRSVILDAIENPQCVDLSVFDNFPLFVEFGLRRLLGFLIKAGAVQDKKEGFPDNYFESQKVKTALENKIPNSIFAGVIKHVDGQRGVMANIREYLSQAEYKALKKGTPGAKAKEVKEEEEVEENGMGF